MKQNEKNILNKIMNLLEAKAQESLNDIYMRKKKTNYNRGVYDGCCYALEMLDDAFGKDL